ncbi:tetratricopeptide repeat protein [Gemmata sp.]|uniref:tetratricopeptide repeat protein n=1 Tax=Gemmata sp. TaxID=1914242 RepID=UPI003F726F67
MTRVTLLVLCGLVGAWATLSVRADEPPKKLTTADRKELEAKWNDLNGAGLRAYEAGKYADAAKALQDALAVARRLYPTTEFSDGHANLATGLNNLASVYRTQGRQADAEPLFKDALLMAKRLFKEDHPDVALALNNLAGVYQDQGKLAEAEPLFKDALLMAKRLFKGDHLYVAHGLNNLAYLYQTQGKLADAEPLFKDAVQMTRRLCKGDHPDVARGMSNLGALYREQDKWADAEPLFKDALEMTKRLHKDDHPEVANLQSNLASVYRFQGKLADAEPLFKDALEMRRRMFNGVNPDTAISLSNLAGVYQARGKLADAERLFKDALQMTRRLFRGDHPEVARGMSNLAGVYRDQGNLADAEPLARDALQMWRRLFKGDHPEVARGMSNLAGVYQARGKPTDAEPLFKDALQMWGRFVKGDHPEMALALNNLAGVYQDQGKLADAEPLLRDALQIRRRLFKGDHPDVAGSLNNLAYVYTAQDKVADAEPLFKEALGVYTRLFAGDHPAVARGLSNVAAVYQAQGRLGDAEPLLRDALAMTRRLFKGDHPDVAGGLNNTASLYQAQGRLGDAEPLLRDALAMRRRLFPGDHPEVANSLSNLAGVYTDQGRPADAEPLLRDALQMYRNLVAAHARTRSEGEALTLAASQPLARDGFLSAVRARGARAAHFDPTPAYSTLWVSKGAVARVFEQRQQQARAAVKPELAKAVAALADARRRRAELLLAPAAPDPATLARREEALKTHDATIADLTRTLAALPAVARAVRLNEATLPELQKALPPDAVLIDYFRYTYFEFDNAKPVGQKRRSTPRYAAFVAARDKVAWVDLGAAEGIERAVGLWREAITTPPHAVPAELPAKVRELVWEPVRRHLPAGAKVAYVCPDAELTRVPWAALPGDRPGTILLEDYAVAAVPHAPFLLDMLWPADPRDGAPAGLLAVGGVAFATGAPSPGSGAVAPRGGDPLVDTRKKLTWPDLPGAKVEAEQVAKRARDRRLAAELLTGPAASADAVLAALPRAKYAHIATHGFFADAQFRSVLQVDPKDYHRSLRGERIGRAANSPMVMSGLVLAGANVPGTPGRGIVTGEALVDRDLSGLELAVLSACETGLGEVAGGEGVFGLQRAFHVAGARNVVASLWKVPDAVTAAVMGEFYRALWDEKLPPVLALQRAQLAVYRADPKEFRALAVRGPGLGDANFDAAGPAGGRAPVNASGKNPAVIWAAFTLSGVGR